MQVSMSNHKSTKSAIKNMEIQVGQLAKQIAKILLEVLGPILKKIPKEECKAVITKSKTTAVFCKITHAPNIFMIHCFWALYFGHSSSIGF